MVAWKVTNTSYLPQDDLELQPLALSFNHSVCREEGDCLTTCLPVLSLCLFICLSVGRFLHVIRRSLGTTLVPLCVTRRCLNTLPVNTSATPHAVSTHSLVHLCGHCLHIFTCTPLCHHTLSPHFRLYTPVIPDAVFTFLPVHLFDNGRCLHTFTCTSP